MRIDRRNPEGYNDPTAYGALVSIERENKPRVQRDSAYNARAFQEPPRQYPGPNFRPLVFICSPYADDPINNERRATRYCRFAVDQGYLPIAPHLYLTRFMNDCKKEDRDAALFMCQVLLGKCTELWYFGNRITSGMEREIERAKERRMVIRQFTEDMQEVNRYAKPRT